MNEAGKHVKSYLDQLVKKYNRLEFIELDPISIPHRFQKKQDIEIAGLFAAVFAWGQRKTILAKTSELLKRMDDAPYDFVLNYQDTELKKMEGFVHRTFNDTDLLYFIDFLRLWYQENESLESAFVVKHQLKEKTIESGLNQFRKLFVSMGDMPSRTGKHISSPMQGSACKRLNMYLRWMVRKDEMGVDFGLWTNISTSQLVCPLDVHVARVARKIGLLQRAQNDWKAAIELTDGLRNLSKLDPVKYDFALFGAGVEGEL